MKKTYGPKLVTDAYDDTVQVLADHETPGYVAMRSTEMTRFTQHEWTPAKARKLAQFLLKAADVAEKMVKETSDE